MDRTKILHSGHMTQCDLQNVRDYLKQEELDELNKKSIEILKLFKFRDVDSEALAEKMFALGYLAAHLDSMEKLNK